MVSGVVNRVINVPIVTDEPREGNKMLYWDTLHTIEVVLFYEIR
jgi:hypothetical protein